MGYAGSDRPYVFKFAEFIMTTFLRLGSRTPGMLKVVVGRNPNMYPQTAFFEDEGNQYLNIRLVPN